jgi:hypothetical protein
MTSSHSEILTFFLCPKKQIHHRDESEVNQFFDC